MFLLSALVVVVSGYCQFTKMDNIFTPPIHRIDFSIKPTPVQVYYFLQSKGVSNAIIGFNSFPGIVRCALSEV
jgi:hypothetical protein